MLGHLLPMFRALAELDAGFSPEERAVVARYLEGARRALERAADGAGGAARGDAGADLSDDGPG